MKKNNRPAPSIADGRARTPVPAIMPVRKKVATIQPIPSLASPRVSSISVTRAENPDRITKGLDRRRIADGEQTDAKRIEKGQN